MRLMDDLISRQAAIDAADKIIERDTSGNNDVVRAMTAWKAYVEGLPSAQPKIVRCKDCVYHRKCMLQHFVESNAVDGAKIDWNKWYCADGEARNDE